MKKRIIPAAVLILAVFLLMGGAVLAQAPIFPVYYSGSATAAGEAVPDGTELYATVGTWTSPSTTVSDGAYSLSVSPPDRTYIGETVEFYIDGIAAAETDTFPDTLDPDTSRFRTLDLTFPEMPEVGDVSLSWVVVGLAALGALSAATGIGILRRRHARA